jgi:hypothetical protein
MTKLTSTARVNIQKYLYYTKAVSAINMLIKQIMNQLEKTRQQEKDLQALTVEKPSRSEVDDCFKKPAPSKRRKLSYADDRAFSFIALPTEVRLLYVQTNWLKVLQHIVSYLSYTDLMRVCLVDKLFYQITGNDVRWQELCADLDIETKPPNQTWKTIFVIYKHGPKRLFCQHCGKKCTRYLSTNDITVCQTCQDQIFVDKYQAQVSVLFILHR